MVKIIMAHGKVAESLIAKLHFGSDLFTMMVRVLGKNSRGTRVGKAHSN
jgi:hypothetical protein